MVSSNKTVVAYYASGALSMDGGIAGDYLGIFGAAPGIRQATSVNGSGFWLSGGGAQGRGFQYLSSPTAKSTSYVSGAVSGEPGFTDARGVTIFNGQLFGSDSIADESLSGVYYEGEPRKRMRVLM